MKYIYIYVHAYLSLLFHLCGSLVSKSMFFEIFVVCRLVLYIIIEFINRIFIYHEILFIVLVFYQIIFDVFIIL